MTIVELPYTTLEIYDDYFVARTNAGVKVDMEKHRKVIAEVEKVISPPFGFIIDEVNDYSVSLEVMLDLKRDSRFVCGAIVSYRSSTIRTLASAVEIIGKPVVYFNSLDEAKNWVQSKIDKFKATKQLFDND